MRWRVTESFWLDMIKFFVIDDAGISGDTSCVYTDETKQSVCLKLSLCFIACLKVELQERHLYLSNYKIAYWLIILWKSI